VDRFFQSVLRQQRVIYEARCRLAAMILAGCLRDGSFLKIQAERNATSVTVRFWHDTRDLDWQSTLSRSDKINAQRSGETLEQLEVQLALWALAK